MSPTSHIAAGALLLAATVAPTIGSTAAVAAKPARHADALYVRFTPNPPRLHSTLGVTVSGLRPHSGLTFVLNRVPKTPAFGGPVGTFYANSHGSLHFVYPQFRYRAELGRWTLVGYRPNGAVALRVSFRVIQ